ncbi:hypothetical protein BXZ70DRAFT_457399 [Cristinia sonorae]|uniref:F-box domain-containing protein n=1 Tax=Cristinia sonorae TaxID=1940300 RepID=A0A8K0XM81_9AGAR|nr:hypothetical protein BXZ70DRAFT_457399 [Cristinia sonorae]
MTSSQTTGSLPSLPQELIDRIIDCHQDDGQNLRSFALVSYSWMIRARRHLFTSVTVSKNFPLRGEKSHFASFVRVLQAGPSVSHAVQRLSINHTTTTLQEIFPILHQLVQLRALSLFTVSIPPSSTIADMTPVFDSLELLVLSSCSVERVEDVVWLICLLSRSLKALHILSLFHTASSGRDVDPSPIPGELSGHNRHIDALVFKPNLDRGHDELCSQLVTGLLNLLDDRSLTSLDINLDPHPFSWVKGTSRLLTVAAPRLQNLNVVILNSSASNRTSLCADADNQGSD